MRRDYYLLQASVFIVIRDTKHLKLRWIWNLLEAQIAHTNTHLSSDLWTEYICFAKYTATPRTVVSESNGS